MEKKRGLTAAQLAGLDALITTAQERGRKLADPVLSTEEACACEAHEAMWEGRHGGLEVNPHDLAVFRKMRELAATLEFAPTLEQLIELRGEALRTQGR